MPTNTMEISDKEIKISYRRYLSDSAPGFIIILALLVCFYLQLPFFGVNIRAVLPEIIQSEILVFVLFVLFLLATPFGLVVNALSWALLEWMQGLIEWHIFIRFPALFKEHKTMYFFDEFKKEYVINSHNDWRKAVVLLHLKLFLEHDTLADLIEPVRGLTIFLRNLSFLSFLGIWAFQIPFGIGFVLGILFLAASAITLFYYQVQIVCWNYLIKTGKVVS